MGNDGADTNVHYPAPIFPPQWDFAKSFWGMMAPMLMGGTMPTFPNNVDPGLSPTMQQAIQMAQGYAASPAPYSMGQAGSTLGAFMNPQMASAGWGVNQGRPGYMPMPGMPQGYPQGPYNPWAAADQTYGGGGQFMGGGGQTGMGNPYARMNMGGQ